MVLGGTMIYSMASPPRVVAQHKKYDVKDEKKFDYDRKTKAGEVESTQNGGAAEHSTLHGQSQEQNRASSTSVKTNGSLRQR